MPQGPFTEAGLAYSASKWLAYRATRDFTATHKPTYTIVNLMPSYIVGRWELALTAAALASGSNGIALSSILRGLMPQPVAGITVYVADVARVHVEAMTKEQIKTHEDFVLNADGTDGVVWTDTIKIAEKHFPKAVAKGILPLGGKTPTSRRRVDGSKTEKVFGMEMVSFENRLSVLLGSMSS